LLTLDRNYLSLHNYYCLPKVSSSCSNRGSYKAFDALIQAVAAFEMTASTRKHLSALLAAMLLIWPSAVPVSSATFPVHSQVKTKHLASVVAFLSKQRHEFRGAFGRIGTAVNVRGGAVEDSENDKNDAYETDSTEVEEDALAGEEWEEKRSAPVTSSEEEESEESFDELEEAMLKEASVELAEMEELEEEDSDVAEEPQDDVIFQEEILVQVGKSENEEDTRLLAATTDGELADDEGGDCVSTPEDASELAAVAAGGAAVAIEEEESVADEGADQEARDKEDTGLQETVEISDEMKDVLRNELHYTARDVRLMRPEIASMVVYNRLIRPIEGMPRNWYIEGAGPVDPRRKKIELAAKWAACVAVGILARTAYEKQEIDLTGVTDSLRGAIAGLSTIPKAFTSAGQQIKETAVAALPSHDEQSESSSPSEKTFSEEEMQEMEDEVVHSVKPGTKKVPNRHEDKTALDKFLTKIEDLIKGFFRIEI